VPNGEFSHSNLLDRKLIRTIPFSFIRFRENRRRSQNDAGCCGWFIRVYRFICLAQEAFYSKRREGRILCKSVQRVDFG
jgi:hypothetical protein